MRYYKIIADGMVVDAGELFLKWQPKNRILIACDPKEAQFITSYSRLDVYRVPWLNPSPKEAGEYRVVDAALINRQEFLDIRAILDDGEDIPVNEPIVSEPQDVVDKEDISEESNEIPRAETISELRSRVNSLETAVNELISRLN